MLGSQNCGEFFQSMKSKSDLESPGEWADFEVGQKVYTAREEEEDGRQ